VAIVQRTRLGQLLVAFALVVLVASGLALALGAVVTSTSVATDAAPELIHVDVMRAPIEAELGRAVTAALPPGSISAETSAVVAARIVRDGAVVDEIARATAGAHDLWTSGEATVLVLDPEVVTPAAIAALRDVDLGLARTVDTGLRVVPAAIALPATATSSDRVDQVTSLGNLGVFVGLVALIGGAVLDVRRDRTIRSISTALFVLGLALCVTPLLARLPDVVSWGWSSAVVVEMLAAALVPLVVAGVASLAMGAFLRAVASQLAPTITARIEARERDAITPPPAPTGAHLSKRKGKEVRQQAIDAFFGPESDETSSTPNDPGEVAAPAPIDPRTISAGPRRSTSDGFAQAVDAVDSAPGGDDDEDDSTERDAGVDEAEAAAAERREALERLDGQRSPLRTHLPR
jgi:hypothetical protein